MTTPDTLHGRLLDAFLTVQAQLSRQYQKRRLTNKDFGVIVAAYMRRPKPFAPNTVSQWLTGVMAPDVETIQAIAELTGLEPGWLAFGKAAAESGGVPMISPDLYQQLTSASTPRLKVVGKKRAARGKGRRGA